MVSFRPRDRRKYFEIALASALECAACLDILVIRKHLPLDQANIGKTKLQRVVSAVMGLIRSTETQLAEETAVYEVNGGED